MTTLREKIHKIIMQDVDWSPEKGCYVFQPDTEDKIIKVILKTRPKKRNSKHTGHEIDDYYCIDCQEGVKAHPDEISGFNSALDLWTENIKK